MFNGYKTSGRLKSSRVFPGGSGVKNLPAVQEPRETQVRSLGWEDPLEEGMATHSSILAWEIPWTEELGGLQSMGSRDRWWWWLPPDVPPQCHWTVHLKVGKMVHFIIYIRLLVTQSSPTLCDPMDCSLPGSAVHGILQAREWVGTGVDSHSFSRISSWPRDQIQVSYTSGRFFTIWATREAHIYYTTHTHTHTHKIIRT